MPITPNVYGLPNPQSWARHLRLCFSANAAPRQGLGEESAANEAGTPVLYAVQSSPSLSGRQAWCPPKSSALRLRELGPQLDKAVLLRSACRIDQNSILGPEMVLTSLHIIP